jgi:hypothetical protein
MLTRAAEHCVVIKLCTKRSGFSAVCSVLSNKLIVWCSDVCSCGHQKQMQTEWTRSEAAAAHKALCVCKHTGWAPRGCRSAPTGRKPAHVRVARVSAWESIARLKEPSALTLTGSRSLIKRDSAAFTASVNLIAYLCHHALSSAASCLI